MQSLRKRLTPDSEASKRWWRENAGLWIACIAAAFTFLALGVLWAAGFEPRGRAEAVSETSTIRGILAFLFAMWAIGPPIWFFYEWTCLFPADKEEQATMQKSQEYAGKIWASVLAVLGVFYGLK